MVRMMALLQQSEQGIIAGKAATGQMTADKASFAESYAQIAAKGESVHGSEVAATTLGQKTNEGVAQKIVGQQFVGVKGQAGLVLNAPTKKTEDVLQEAKKSVDGALENPVVPSSKPVGLNGSTTKRSVLNVKVNQAEVGVVDGDSSGQIKEDNFAVVDARELGTATGMSDTSVETLSMVKQDVVALGAVRGDEVAVTKEVGDQGMKDDAVMGSKPHRVEPGKGIKSKTTADSGSAEVVMTGSTSMAAAADVTVPMAQQTVAASQPLQRSEGEVIAVAAGQGKKRDAGVGIDRPERRQDSRPGVEQAGVGQPGTAAAGEIAVTGRKGPAWDAQITAVDETGKATVVTAGVEGAKVQELVAADVLMVGC